MEIGQGPIDGHNPTDHQLGNSSGTKEVFFQNLHQGN